MSSLSLKYSKAANLFEILIWYRFLTSSSFSFLRLNMSPSNYCATCLLTSNFSLTFSTTRIWSISKSAPLKQHTCMPSPIYQDMIILVVFLSIRSSPGYYYYRCAYMGIIYIINLLKYIPNFLKPEITTWPTTKLWGGINTSCTYFKALKRYKTTDFGNTRNFQIL